MSGPKGLPRVPWISDPIWLGSYHARHWFLSVFHVAFASCYSTRIAIFLTLATGRTKSIVPAPVPRQSPAPYGAYMRPAASKVTNKNSNTRSNNAKSSCQQVTSHLIGCVPFLTAIFLVEFWAPLSESWRDAVSVVCGASRNSYELDS